MPSATDGRLAWRALRAGEFVLGYDDEDGGPPPAPAAPLHRNGSFMVWRKLRQDVAGFRAWLAEAAGSTGYDEGLLAAKVIGRWPDGSPLILRPRYGDRVLGNDSGASTTSATATTRGLRLPARRPHPPRQPPRRAARRRPAHGPPPDPAPRDAVRRAVRPRNADDDAGTAASCSSPCRRASSASSRSSRRAG